MSEMIWNVLLWLLLLVFIIGVALILIAFVWVLISDTEAGRVIDKRIARMMKGADDD